MLESILSMLSQASWKMASQPSAFVENSKKCFHKITVEFYTLPGTTVLTLK